MGPLFAYVNGIAADEKNKPPLSERLALTQ
jgi:hypothetical protein